MNKVEMAKERDSLKLDQYIKRKIIEKKVSQESLGQYQNVPCMCNCNSYEKRRVVQKTKEKNKIKIP